MGSRISSIWWGNHYQQSVLEIHKSFPLSILGITVNMKCDTSSSHKISASPPQSCSCKSDHRRSSAMVGSLMSKALMKYMQWYAAKILGSNQNWFQRHQELCALLDHRGPPTWQSASKYVLAWAEQAHATHPRGPLHTKCESKQWSTIQGPKEPNLKPIWLVKHAHTHRSVFSLVRHYYKHYLQFHWSLALTHTICNFIGH